MLCFLQRALWETDRQAQQWQQHLATQQRLRKPLPYTLGRNISMPSSSNNLAGVNGSLCRQYSDHSHCNNSQCSTAASTASGMQHQPQVVVPHLSIPCAQVPSSKSEILQSCMLPDVPSLTSLVNRSLLRTCSNLSTSSNAFKGSNTRSRAAGAAKASKRRATTDTTSPLYKGYQPVRSLAAKGETAAQNASATSRSATGKTFKPYKAAFVRGSSTNWMLNFP